MTVVETWEQLERSMVFGGMEDKPLPLLKIFQSVFIGRVGAHHQR
jgi:hypothetical protein